MIIKYSNGDELHFPNIPDIQIQAEAQPLQKPWVRDAKGNWVRES